LPVSVKSGVSNGSVGDSGTSLYPKGDFEIVDSGSFFGSSKSSFLTSSLIGSIGVSSVGFFVSTTSSS